MIISNNSTPTLLLLKRIWVHLSFRRRFQLLSLAVVMCASGIAELVSLGAVLPFLAVLTNPQQLWEQSWIQSLAVSAGFSESRQLVLPASFVFALAAALAALIRLLNLWLNGRLSSVVGSDLSCEAYRRTLYQPYQVHVQRNSSTLISAMTQHIGVTVLALNAVLQIALSSVVAAGLLIGLLIIDWQVAVITGLLFSTAYMLLAFATRRSLAKNSIRIAEKNKKRLQVVQEGLGAIRDVILDASQATYLDLYRRSDRTQRLSEAQNNFFAQFPRFALEALGLVSLAIMGGLWVLQREDSKAVIPVLGALALGAQRLLPALQQIYTGWANLKGWNAGLSILVDLLDQPLPKKRYTPKPSALRTCICLQNVSYKYSEDSPKVLRNLNLVIKRGERVGLIGSTGSGKSTLVDILMGLLLPSSGKLLVDNVNVNEANSLNALVDWRATVAHVPQSIYLADSSIAENIAFGVPTHLIDMSRVEKSAEQAQIASFIESNSLGYSAFVGERGIRLSGGQRQRIGIARALYKQASVIVLDEATSSLDNSTEEAVMESVEGLSRDLTIVMIAHRLSTLQRCDRVVRLDQGSVVAEGPPQKMLSNFA